MDEPAPRVRALSATLMPDCAIEVEVALPGWDEPQTTTIEQSADFLSRVGDKPRPIDLTGLDSMDLLAQVHIAKHLARIEREIARRQAFDRRLRPPVPSAIAYEPYAC